MNRKARLNSAKDWLPKYEGKNIVKGYRRHYGVDTICAINELQILGVKFDPDYVEKVKCFLRKLQEQRQAEKQRKKTKQLQELYADSDDTFAYIVGYTSWGFPYGVTWEEIGDQFRMRRFLVAEIMHDLKASNTYRLFRDRA